MEKDGWTRAIRVLLADDHTVLRAGLCMLLNAHPDMEVVGEAADGTEAVAKAGQLRPDVILMDITMPGTSALSATEQVRRANPQVKVLVLTMHDDERYLRQFLGAGASGYVLKKAADAELVEAIRAVHRGDVYVHPSMVGMLVEGYLHEKPGAARRQDGYGGLTEREREVLQLIAEGYTNQQTAERLFISVKTVETHRAHIMEKLRLRSRAELVRYAIEKGLLRN